MKIRNVKHRGLQRLIKDDDPSGVQPAVADKVRKIISFLQDMAHVEELRTVPTWKVHQLTGDRKGTWSLHVTKNWRIVFGISQAGREIIGLDFEDYH